MAVNKDFDSHQIILWFGFFSVLSLLLLPNMVLVIRESAPFSMARAGELLGTSVFIWLLLLITVNARYFFLITLPFVWLAPLEAIYCYWYGRTTDIHLFGILADTTFDEAIQYCKPYLIYGVVYLFSTMYMSLWLAKYAAVERLKLPGILVNAMLCSAVLLVISIGLASYMLNKQEVEAFGGDDLRQVLLFQEQQPLVVSAVVDVYPFGMFVRLSNYRKQLSQMAHLKEELKSFRFNAKSSARSGKEIYVLVVGETARANNWQLNGYDRETNPNLSQKKNLVSFSNMVSGWLWTRMSVPLIISRKTMDNQNIFFPEKSIVSLFSEAGFTTWWLSMQSPYGFHDSPIALHSHEADHVRFLNPVDYKGSGDYDDALLAQLKEALAAEGNKTFVVLHLLGSHFNYGDRYPDKFDIFQPSMKQKMVSLQDKSEKQRLLNSYDNSILFTDYVLSQIIEIVDAQKSVAGVLYVADHGELIFDGDCDKSGHGYNTEWEHRNASALWLSDAYIAGFPEKASYAFAKKNAPLSTNNMFYSMAGMAEIRYANIDSTRDIFSESWIAYPRRLQNGMDFDNSGRGAACKEIIPKVK